MSTFKNAILDPFEINQSIFPDPPDLDGAESWIKYHIRDYPEQVGVTVFVSTNDNWDEGWPSEYEQWTLHYDTLAAALERTGITKESSGYYVWLNGDPVHDRDIERHKKRIEVVKLMKRNNRIFNAGLNKWDVNQMLAAIRQMDSDLIPFLEEEYDAEYGTNN